MDGCIYDSCLPRQVHDGILRCSDVPMHGGKRDGEKYQEIMQIRKTILASFGHSDKHRLQSNSSKGTVSYQLGNTSFRTITEVKQR